MLCELPCELIMMICEYLEVTDLVTLGQVNSHLRTMLDDQWLWLGLCKSSYNCQSTHLLHSARSHYVSVHTAVIAFLIKTHSFENAGSISLVTKDLFNDWKSSYYALEYYLEQKDFEAAEYLLDHGFSLSVLDDEGGTLLHRFIQKDGGHLDSIMWLIEHGVEVNGEDFVCWTPLHHAGYLRKMDVFNLLLKYNGDPNIVDYDEQTPYDLLESPL